MKFNGKKFQKNSTKELSQKASENTKLTYLTDYSSTDKPWDTHRAQCDDVTAIYATVVEFKRNSHRMSDCSGILRFSWITAEDTTGETRIKLKEARFCRVRYCPVCQWRRSRMWLARFYKSLPSIVSTHKTARWLFLTLTLRNPPIQELGKTLTDMNAAWQRLIQRDAFKPVIGWIRTTEVSRAENGEAHPHFHVLLMVKPSWFSTNYVKHDRWVSLWREALRVNYDPGAHIKTVKPKDNLDDEHYVVSLTQALQGAVAETLKYSTKPDDMMADSEWFLELTRQTRKRRFIATGGVLKNILRESEESDKDLIEGGDADSGDDEGVRLAFGWKRKERRYRRHTKQNIKK